MCYTYFVLLIATCVMSANSAHAMDASNEQKSALVQKKRTFMQDLADGAIAGVAEVMVNNPFVVIKYDVQKAMKQVGIKVVVDRPRDFQSFIKKYYKGCGVGVAFAAPITALQNSITLLLGRVFDDNPTLEQKAVAAFGAGWLAALLASPADLLVLQRQNELYAGESLVGTLRRVYKVNGLATLYRGFNATGVRDGIFTAAYKTGGNGMSQVFPTITGHSKADTVLCASLAGVVAAILSHPADVVATRMKSDLTGSYYKTCLQAGYRMMKEEGVPALFKGLVARTLRIMVAIPLMSLVLNYEPGTKMLKKIGG